MLRRVSISVFMGPVRENRSFINGDVFKDVYVSDKITCDLDIRLNIFPVQVESWIINV